MEIGFDPKKFLYWNVKQAEFKILGPDSVFFHNQKSRWMKSQPKQGDFITIDRLDCLCSIATKWNEKIAYISQ